MNISSIGKTTKSMMDLKKPPVCHNCDTFCLIKNLNFQSTFMTNSEFVYEISERNSQICVFWCVIVTHLCRRHLNMVQWIEFHPMNISSIGSTTKIITDPMEPPVCHNWDTMCPIKKWIYKAHSWPTMNSCTKFQSVIHKFVFFDVSSSPIYADVIVIWSYG